MKWKEFTIRTTTAAEDLIADMLADLGIDGVEVRDHMEIMDGDTFEIFQEVMPEMQPDDGRAEVVFYLDEEEDTKEWLEKVREGLSDIASFTDIGEGTIDTGETEDKDWVNNWKEHFSAFYVDDILIKPTWVEKPAGDHSSLMIEIDPGTAFGTGAHETTQLCIRALRKYLKPGDSVLDVGTGSGILGIVALKTGAAFAYGTDIDEMAVRTAAENIALNGISAENFPVVTGNIIDDSKVQAAAGYEKYDIVVANILADIIIPLQKNVWRQLKKGGLLIVSGIINTRAKEVESAILENGALEILDSACQGEWVSFTAKRKENGPAV